METKDFELPVEQTAPIEETPTAPVRVRGNARRRAANDAAVLFAQQAILCGAIAAGCSHAGLALTAVLFLAVTAGVGCADFFFGGFISGNWRIVVRVGLCTIGYAAISLIFYLVTAVFAVIGLSVLTFAALYAINARLRVSFDRETPRYVLMHILTAVLLAAAVAGFGPVL